MNKSALMASLTGEEGFRSLVYDDATGKDLKPGMMLKGNPTIGIGWNVAGRPCTPELAQMILGYHVDQTWAELIQAIPWITHLPEPCQRALTDMAFNMGAAKLLKFNIFIGLMRAEKFAEAAADLETTLWWKQVGTRGPKVKALVLEGKSYNSSGAA